MDVFLKAILESSNDYQGPSGVPTKGGFAAEHGYGHEEWNNSPRLRYDLDGQSFRAFHTERLGTYEFDDRIDVVIVMYARGHRLVGISGRTRQPSEAERHQLTSKLRLRDLWPEVWRMPGVKKAHGGSKEESRRRWNADVSWIPNWTCPSDHYYQPKETVRLDPARITGRTRLLPRFDRYTRSSPEALSGILDAIPKRMRDDAWTNIRARVGAVLAADDLGEAAERDLIGDLKALTDDRRLKLTTRQLLIDARLGQGKFRTDVLQNWNDRCAVTGCALSEVIRASHIRPWSVSDSKQRVDADNGLPLVGNLDMLFDRGLISFQSNGRMLISKRLCPVQRKQLHVPKNLRRTPSAAQEIYLKYHRRYCFRPD